MAEETRYWLLTGELPTGPVAKAELHSQLAEGKLTWQTRVCRVGDSQWITLLELPGFGPKAIPQTPVSEPSLSERAVTPPTIAATTDLMTVNTPIPISAPSHTAISSPSSTDSSWMGYGLIFIVFFVGFFLYSWIWPLTPRDVCEKFNSALTAAEAKKYATSNLSRAIDEIYKGPQSSDPDQKFEWTADSKVPGTNNQHYVGCKGQLYLPEVGRRVTLEMVFHCVDSKGWKVNDFIVIGADGKPLPQPISLATEYPSLNPSGNSFLAPTAKAVKDWYEKPENKVGLAGSVGVLGGILLLTKTGAGKFIFGGIAAIIAGIVAWYRKATRQHTT